MRCYPIRPKRPSSFGSTTSRSSFTRSIRFRFASAISTGRPKNTSSSRGVPTLFFGSGGVHSKGHQRTFPGWPAVAFHRAHDTGPEFAAGALCRRRVVREPVAAIAGGEPADPGVGCELAAAGDFPVRMVAACPAARPLRATFQSRHRNKAISRRRVVAGRGKRERSLQRSARPHLRAQLIQINVVGAGRLTLNLS